MMTHKQQRYRKHTGPPWRTGPQSTYQTPQPRESTLERWAPIASGFGNQQGLCPGEPKSSRKPRLHLSFKGYTHLICSKSQNRGSSLKSTKFTHEDNFANFRACCQRNRDLLQHSPEMEALAGRLFTPLLLGWPRADRNQFRHSPPTEHSSENLPHPTCPSQATPHPANQNYPQAAHHILVDGLGQEWQYCSNGPALYIRAPAIISARPCGQLQCRPTAVIAGPFIQQAGEAGPLTSISVCSSCGWASQPAMPQHSPAHLSPHQSQPSHNRRVHVAHMETLLEHLPWVSIGVTLLDPTGLLNKVTPIKTMRHNWPTSYTESDKMRRQRNMF